MRLLVAKTCSECSEPFDGYEIQDQCWNCKSLIAKEAVEMWRIEALASLPALASHEAQHRGLSTEEIHSRMDHVPVEMKRLVPKQTVLSVLDGRVPRHGFGLIGSTGSGKTSFLATMATSYTLKILGDRLGAVEGIPDPYDPQWHFGIPFGYRWLSWPTASVALKSGWKNGEDPLAFMNRYAQPKMLFLDDLGRERVKGSYTEDYSVSILDKIVDARSRAGLPIFWTSNVSLEDLNGIYGSAFMSRLVSLGAPVLLPKLPDLRLEEL